ncbi:MAG TPA: DUF935 family protein, partial [Elusimicrobiales bacterium]|nr:DUF935 family protein [Elusimicrobiales bacterium]
MGNFINNAFRTLIQKIKPDKPTKPFLDIELATDDRAIFKRFKYSQYTADNLLSKKGIKIYNEMVETDSRIESAINTLKTIRLSSGWDVVSASNEAKDLEIRDFVKWNLENLENSFEDDLREIMGALEMGVSINEIIWRVCEKGKYNGKVIISNIKSKDPSKFNINTDDFDNILENGIINISNYDWGKEYPTEKFIIYSFNKKYENIFGTSRLKSLYSLWFLKQRLLEAWGVFMEKYGNPTSILKAPQSIYDEAKENLLYILKQLRFETSIVLPEGVEYQIMS